MCGVKGQKASGSGRGQTELIGVIGLIVIVVGLVGVGGFVVFDEVAPGSEEDHSYERTKVALHTDQVAVTPLVGTEEIPSDNVEVRLEFPDSSVPTVQYESLSEALRDDGSTYSHINYIRGQFDPNGDYQLGDDLVFGLQSGVLGTSDVVRVQLIDRESNTILTNSEIRATTFPRVVHTDSGPGFQASLSNENSKQGIGGTTMSANANPSGNPSGQVEPGVTMEFGTVIPEDSRHNYTRDPALNWPIVIDDWDNGTISQVVEDGDTLDPESLINNEADLDDGDLVEMEVRLVGQSPPTDRLYEQNINYGPRADTVVPGNISDIEGTTMRINRPGRPLPAADTDDGVEFGWRAGDPENHTARSGFIGWVPYITDDEAGSEVNMEIDYDLRVYDSGDNLVYETTITTEETLNSAGTGGPVDYQNHHFAARFADGWFDRDPNMDEPRIDDVWLVPPNIRSTHEVPAGGQKVWGEYAELTINDVSVDNDDRYMEIQFQPAFSLSIDGWDQPESVTEDASVVTDGGTTLVDHLGELDRGSKTNWVSVDETSAFEQWDTYVSGYGFALLQIRYAVHTDEVITPDN
jgi:hypothetical protein